MSQKMINHGKTRFCTADNFGYVASLILVSFALFSWQSKAGDQSAAVHYQLLTAEKIKSSNPQQFNRLVAGLVNNKEHLSLRQLDHLNYLVVYQMTFEGKFDEALTAAHQILHSNASDLLKFRTRLTIVNIHALAQNWNEGLMYLSNALAKLPQISDEENHQNGLAVAGTFYNQLAQYRLGLDYARRLKSRKLDGRNRCIANQLILESKFALGQIDAGSNEINLAIDSCEKSGEILMVTAIRTYVATQLIDDGYFVQARNYLLRYLSQAELTSYPPILTNYYSLLAKAYYAEKNIAQAQAFGLKTIPLLTRTTATQSIMAAYDILYLVAKHRMDYQTAFQYLELYSQAYNTYLDKIETKNLAYQLAKHTAVAQEKQIELFKQQNKLLISEKLLAISNAENDRLLIALLIIMGTLLGYWIYKSKAVRKRLTKMAQYDALTGVYSRGHFTEIASGAIRYCQKSEQQLSCVVFDLDWFKSINDSHGHDRGDWVLKKVVAQCRRVIRNNDIFGRIGGEEFCMVFPGCSLDLAMKLAERCRQAIDNIDTTPVGAKFNVSASFGVTSANLSGLDLEQLIADADSAMYQSKNNQRNSVTKFCARAPQLDIEIEQALVSAP